MFDFARRSSVDRQRIFREVGMQKAIGSHIIEKDFWVCWLLLLIFDDKEFGNHLIFKGGTSLSKVFGIINRFSEDIDLSVDPDWLGFSGNDRPDAAPSRSQFDKRVNALEDACIEKVRDHFLPELNHYVQTTLPGHVESSLSFEVDEAAHSPVLLFAYPREGQTGSLRPQIKLEFGSLYDQRPAGSHTIRSITAEIFPGLFHEPFVRVVALEAERTFWEKATLLHAEYHRPPDKPSPIGISRHYSDLAALGRHVASQRALSDFDLLNQVRTHKQTYFRSSWAHYETAKPGSFHLAPAPKRMVFIERDYHDMADMFMTPPPSFNTIQKELIKLENRINGGQAA
jgi:hypothetical protein